MNTPLTPPIIDINWSDLSYDFKAQTPSLTAFYQSAMHSTLPMALWQTPQSQTQHGLVDFSGQAETHQLNFEHQQAGFSFAPFINPKGTETRFIKASLYLQTRGQESGSLDVIIPPQTPLAQAQAKQFLQYYQGDALRPSPTYPVTHIQPYLSPQAEFCTLVEQAIAYMHRSDIKKIVTSRITQHALSPQFCPLKTFNTLCQRYPHAFVSLVAIPGLGTWLGASPEVLLCMDNEHLQTMALAGTLPHPGPEQLNTVPWSTKEIEEQALVSDYIRHFFKALNLDDVHEIGPETVGAGNVVHLRSLFSLERSTPELRHLANQILHQLHPTSAVCGMPKREALNFILDHEKHQRAFYSGFLGPVHLNGQSQLFVNLRCMQLLPHQALLYVGAGITQDSIPEAEWQETELKAQTLLSILG